MNFCQHYSFKKQSAKSFDKWMVHAAKSDCCFSTTVWINSNNKAETLWIIQQRRCSLVACCHRRWLYWTSCSCDMCGLRGTFLYIYMMYEPACIGTCCTFQGNIINIQPGRYEADYSRILRRCIKKSNTRDLNNSSAVSAAYVYFLLIFMDPICSKWLHLLQRPQASVHRPHRLTCSFNRISRFPPGSPGDQQAGPLLLICVKKMTTIPWSHSGKRVKEEINWLWDGGLYRPLLRVRGAMGCPSLFCGQQRQSIVVTEKPF